MEINKPFIGSNVAGFGALAFFFGYNERSEAKAVLKYGQETVDALINAREMYNHKRNDFAFHLVQIAQQYKSDILTRKEAIIAFRGSRNELIGYFNKNVKSNLAYSFLNTGNIFKKIGGTLMIIGLSVAFIFRNDR